jgi:hypothetical protein
VYTKKCRGNPAFFDSQIVSELITAEVYSSEADEGFFSGTDSVGSPFSDFSVFSGFLAALRPEGDL